MRTSTWMVIDPALIRTIPKHAVRAFHLVEVPGGVVVMVQAGTRRGEDMGPGACWTRCWYYCRYCLTVESFNRERSAPDAARYVLPVTMRRTLSRCVDDTTRTRSARTIPSVAAGFQTSNAAGIEIMSGTLAIWISSILS